MKADWMIRPLNEVCRLINGRAYKQAELLEGGPYPVLRVGNFFTNNHWYYSDLELDANKYCDDGDLLYAWSASFGPRIWQGGKVIYHYHIWKVEPNLQRLDKDYLYYFLDWDKELIKKEQGAGTTMIHVSKGSMEARPIPLPPIAEQQRIVAVLDEAFEGLASARAHVEANLQDARELFDEVVNSCFEKANAKGCESTTLGTLAEFRNGLNYTRTSVGSSVKIVGVGDFRNHFMVPLDSLSEITIDGKLADNDQLRAGDIVAVRSNGNRELIGRTMMVPALTEQVSFSGFTIRVRLTSAKLLPEYLCEYMRTKKARKTLIDGGGGSNISNLNQVLLSSLPIRYPDLETQRNVLDELELARGQSIKLIQHYETKIQSLDAFRQSLLQKAFAGELI